MIMVEEKVEVDKREKFKEKIRIFEKTEMTISDILALYQFILLTDSKNYARYSIIWKHF